MTVSKINREPTDSKFEEEEEKFASLSTVRLVVKTAKKSVFLLLTVW
jgi:hypothetical protein